VIVIGVQKRRDGDNAVASRAILDHDGLRPQRLQSLGKNPRANVRAGAGAEGNNEFYRPPRPRCSTPCKRRSEHDCPGQTGEHECPTGLDHATPFSNVH
jgi:hypothetical protein